MTEAVTNATKYAFPDKRGGMIDVRLAVNGDRVRLSIRDNGVGEQSAGDPALSGGLGRSLMEGLAGQLGGTLTVRHDNGTEVLIEFTVDRSLKSKAMPAEPPATEEP